MSSSQSKSLKALKFQHKFESCLKESVIPFFLCCHHCSNSRTTRIGSLNQTGNGTVKCLLFGDPKYGNEKNKKVITASTNNILKPERFEGTLLSHFLFAFLYLLCFYSTYVEDASCMYYFALKDYCECSSCTSMNIYFYWVLVVVLFLLLHNVLFI